MRAMHLSQPRPYGAVQGAYYQGQQSMRPMQSTYSSSYPAPAGIDIGSVITMMLPLVVIGMMSRVMVSGNAKDAEGKEKDRTKDKAKVKEKQDKVA